MTDPGHQAATRADDPGRPTATLDDVDIGSALSARPRRAPDYAAEDRALSALATEMAERPRNMLQKLVETAVELCHADTAGVSLLEGEVFRWEAVAGVFASSRNGTMPREASPCGVCIDRNATQLMYLADRAFPALRTDPRFVEALLIPFHVHGQPVGTVWIVTHGHDRMFDLEDERVIRALAQFASAGWQLWKAYEAVEATSRRKDEFLPMLGHELRNPLAAILNSSGVLQAVGTSDARAQHAVEVIARQGKHLSRMVDDLLDLSRLSRGTLELRRELVDLRTIVTHAVETMRAQIERRGHDLFVDGPGESVWLEGDRVRMVQLIGNLLDNAAKFTPPGGRISLTVEHADGQVQLTVEDTGVGIAGEALPSVFDQFKPSSHPLEPSRGGFGLGLPLVRSLVELHGGTITVESDGPGQGSRFTVRLPALVNLPPAAPSQASTIQAKKAARRILVVEDDADVADSVAMELVLHGHSVKIACDGEAALEAAQDFRPEVVLLDVGLPGIDGYEVARRLRRDLDLAELTIIALSGYGQDEHRALSKASGCDAHLVKPVDPDVLRQILAGRTV